jgi:hypothetical protein
MARPTGIVRQSIDHNRHGGSFGPASDTYEAGRHAARRAFRTVNASSVNEMLVPQPGFAVPACNFRHNKTAY